MMNYITYAVGSIISAGSGSYNVNIPKVGATHGSIQLILQVVFGIIGAIALLVITFAAFQYTISRGEPQQTARAKDTIIYAAIGLVICVLAFSIVTFVYKNI